MQCELELVLEKDIWVSFVLGPGCSNRGWARLSGDRSVSWKGLEFSARHERDMFICSDMLHQTCLPLPVNLWRELWISCLWPVYFVLTLLSSLLLVVVRECKGAWTCLRILKKARKKVHERLNHAMVSSTGALFAYEPNGNFKLPYLSVSIHQNLRCLISLPAGHEMLIPCNKKVTGILENDNFRWFKEFHIHHSCSFDAIPPDTQKEYETSKSDGRLEPSTVCWSWRPENRFRSSYKRCWCILFDRFHWKYWGYFWQFPKPTSRSLQSEFNYLFFLKSMESFRIART